MKPYGQSEKKCKRKVQGHNSDNCSICNNKDFKMSKKKKRREPLSDDWMSRAYGDSPIS